jgi:hypothetical protein
MVDNTFTTEIDDKEVKLKIKNPNLKDQQESQKIYNEAFNRAIQSKALLRVKLDQFVRDQGIWSDKTEQKVKELQKKISEVELRISQGGFKLSEAKELALKVWGWREDMKELMAARLSYDNNTAEGQADNARFNYLVSACTVYNDSNKAYFKNYEDFLNKNGVDQVAFLASQKLAEIMYGLEDNYEHKFFENEFLKEYGFVDDRLRLVDEEGRLISNDGRLIDEAGQYIDEDGNPVDINGNPLDDEGHIKTEKKPFLDDDGEPIIKGNPTEETADSGQG